MVYSDHQSGTINPRSLKPETLPLMPGLCSTRACTGRAVHATADHGLWPCVSPRAQCTCECTAPSFCLQDDPDDVATKIQCNVAAGGTARQIDADAVARLGVDLVVEICMDLSPESSVQVPKA